MTPAAIWYDSQHDYSADLLTRAYVPVSAMCNLIFSQVYGGESKLVSAAFNTVLPVCSPPSSLAFLHLRIRYLGE